MNPDDVKLENERRLRALGVVVNEYLPMIEHPSELKPRSARDVVVRAYVLSHVIGVGYGREGKEMLDWLMEDGLANGLTPREMQFLKQKNYSEQDRAWAAWQFAAVHGLPGRSVSRKCLPWTSVRTAWRRTFLQERLRPPPCYDRSTRYTPKPISTIACIGPPGSRDSKVAAFQGLKSKFSFAARVWIGSQACLTSGMRCQMTRKEPDKSS